MRVANWPTLLVEYVERHRKVPFEWGTHDCVTFAAGWVKECTGVDHLTELEWDGKISALRLLAVSPLRARVDAIFDRRLHILSAQRGDLALAKNQDDEEHLAVCIGNLLFASPGQDSGLVFNSLKTALIVWEVR